MHVTYTITSNKTSTKISGEFDSPSFPKLFDTIKKELFPDASYIRNEWSKSYPPSIKKMVFRKPLLYYPIDPDVEQQELILNITGAPPGCS